MKIGSPKKFVSKKSFGPENFWSRKYLGPEQNLIPKIFDPKKNVVAKNFGLGLVGYVGLGWPVQGWVMLVG